MLTYRVLSGPTEEPVSLADLKAHLRVTRQEENEYLEALITAAREYAENRTGRVLLQQSIVALSPDWADGTFELLRNPVQSVDTVKYYDTDDVLQTLASSNYIVSPLLGWVQAKASAALPSLSGRPDAVQITFTAGAVTVEDVPASLVHAVRLLASHWFLNRIPINIGNIVNEIPDTHRRLLDMHRLHGWVA